MEDPSDTVRRHFSVRRGDYSVRYDYKGTARHAIPTASHLNQSALKITTIAHHEQLASMTDQHDYNMDVLRRADKADREDKERRLQEDTERKERATKEVQTADNRMIKDYEAQTKQNADECDRIRDKREEKRNKMYIN